MAERPAIVARPETPAARKNDYSNPSPGRVQSPPYDVFGQIAAAIAIDSGNTGTGLPF